MDLAIHTMFRYALLLLVYFNPWSKKFWMWAAMTDRDCSDTWVQDVLALQNHTVTDRAEHLDFWSEIEVDWQQ
jgi:hypothetical protein